MPDLIRPQGRFRGREVEAASRHHLEPAELSALWRATASTPFWHGYFRLQFFFGCRVSEVALVLREDVNWRGAEILVRRLKKPRFPVVTVDTPAGPRRRRDTTAEPGSGFDEVVYPLDADLAADLRRVTEATRAAGIPADNPWLFASARRAGSAPATRVCALRHTGQWQAVSDTQARRAFQAAATAAGVPAHLRHPHVLRHSRATHLLAAGASADEVQHLLGHRSGAVTRVYLGRSKEMQARLAAVARLGWENG